MLQSRSCKQILHTLDQMAALTDRLSIHDNAHQFAVVQSALNDERLHAMLEVRDCIVAS